MNDTTNTNQARPALVNWLGYLALTFLLALPLAVLTVRSGAWQQGLLLYAISCLAGAILLLLAVFLLLRPRFAPWRKAIASRALFALPGTLLLLAILGGGNYPRIHDISTDLDDPLVFTATQALRGPTANSLDTTAETISLQREHYADLQTLSTPTAFEQTFETAVQTATGMGWDIHLQDRNAGIIEAVDTTAIMGFKDDIVVRIRSNADGSVVDMRSVSRVGQSDMGANAARIRAFQQALQDQGL
jgi:uncharacterized protein (DUF1499 family)